MLQEREIGAVRAARVGIRGQFDYDRLFRSGTRPLFLEHLAPTTL
jgi:hypothetical protein